MVDPQQDGKKNGNYEQWTKEESDTLLELMVDAAVRGWRDNSGILSKQIVEERILPVLNAKLGCHKTYKNYQSRVRWFKGRWNSYSTLMRFSSGFGFDSTTKRFTASNEVWEEYLKVFCCSDNENENNEEHMDDGEQEGYDDNEVGMDEYAAF
ncbi:uncharacterized protein At2g29880-like [Rosa rugosa]|uniref:uncharacterized protein At2g29880-like n=1 Tax=Rosa rugosa TaxID=74645 RepID=UPI002B410968|nr:uncharacterized protein At2g29880-like [Rosa rugosa]